VVLEQAQKSSLWRWTQNGSDRLRATLTPAYWPTAWRTERLFLVVRIPQIASDVQVLLRKSSTFTSSRVRSRDRPRKVHIVLGVGGVTRMSEMPVVPEGYAQIGLDTLGREAVTVNGAVLVVPRRGSCKQARPQARCRSSWLRRCRPPLC